MTRLQSRSKLLAIVITLSAAGNAGAQQSVNARGAAIKGFLDRAQAYVELQNKEDAGLPRLQPREDTAKVEEHKRALAARMRQARAGAARGEIFGDAAPYIREVIEKDARTRPAKDKRALLEEVPPADPPRVNAEYPEKSPLATVPPLVLDQLPRLPDGLEYRFMGRDLILRDTRTNLVADILDGAVAVVKP